MSTAHRNQQRSLSPSAKRDTPYKAFNQYQHKRDGVKTDTYWIEKFESFLKVNGSLGYCSYKKVNRHGNSKKKCDCLRNLGNDNFPKLRQAVAEFCFDFAKKKGVGG